MLFHKSISGFGVFCSAKEPFWRQRSICLFSSGWHESRLHLPELDQETSFFSWNLCWMSAPNFISSMLSWTLQFHGFSIRLFLQLQCSWLPHAAIVNESQFPIGWRRPWGDTRDLNGILQHHRLFYFKIYNVFANDAWCLAMFFCLDHIYVLFGTITWYIFCSSCVWVFDCVQCPSVSLILEKNASRSIDQHNLHRNHALLWHIQTQRSNQTIIFVVCRLSSYPFWVHASRGPASRP